MTKRINIITAAAVFIFMLILNFNCPYISDDWHFKFVWVDFMPTSGINLVQSIGDIILSMQNYYMLSGGRVFCHFLAYLMMLVDKSVFNILNSFAFVLLGYLFYLSIKKYVVQYKLSLPLIYLSLMLFLPSFGDNCLWLSGAVNYLWSLVLLLVCILTVNAYAEKQSAPRLILLYFTAALSSVTNETTGGMVILYMLITFVFEYRSFSVKILPAFVLSAVSALTVILAPGNVNRSEELEEVKLFGDSLPELMNILYSYMEYLIQEYSVFIYVILFSIFCDIALKKRLTDIISANKYFITGFAGVAALSLTGFITIRPIIFGVALIMAAAAVSLGNIIDCYRSCAKSTFQWALFTLRNIGGVLVTSASAMIITGASYIITHAIYIYIYMRTCSQAVRQPCWLPVILKNRERRI